MASCGQGQPEKELWRKDVGDVAEEIPRKRFQRQGGNRSKFRGEKRGHTVNSEPCGTGWVSTFNPLRKVRRFYKTLKNVRI